MQFFVESNSFLNRSTDEEGLIKRKAPGVVDALQAVSELREQYRTMGTEGWSADRQWRHVASIYGPALQVCELIDDEFLNGNGKKNFYGWLDQHKRYVTYDRRRVPAKRSDLVTFVDGKEV